MWCFYLILFPSMWIPGKLKVRISACRRTSSWLKYDPSRGLGVCWSNRWNHWGNPGEDRLDVNSWFLTIIIHVNVHEFSRFTMVYPFQKSLRQCLMSPVTNVSDMTPHLLLKLVKDLLTSIPSQPSSHCTDKTSV